LRHFHEENKPTAVICHGPYALLSTKKAGDGSFVYNFERCMPTRDKDSREGGQFIVADGAERSRAAESVKVKNPPQTQVANHSSQTPGVSTNVNAETILSNA
jgi:putative intracellular protease/amidase